MLRKFNLKMMQLRYKVYIFFSLPFLLPINGGGRRRKTLRFFSTTSLFFQRYKRFNAILMFFWTLSMNWCKISKFHHWENIKHNDIKLKLYRKVLFLFGVSGFLEHILLGYFEPVHLFIQISTSLNSNKFYQSFPLANLIYLKIGSKFWHQILAM